MSQDLPLVTRSTHHIAEILEFLDLIRRETNLFSQARVTTHKTPSTKQHLPLHDVEYACLIARRLPWPVLLQASVLCRNRPTEENKHKEIEERKDKEKQAAVSHDQMNNDASLRVYYD